MFNCKITQSCNDSVLFEAQFKNLKEISVELGLTYQQVADISSRDQKKKYQKFKFYPKIEITRIDKNISNSKNEPAEANPQN